MTHFTFSINYI